MRPISKSCIGALLILATLGGCDQSRPTAWAAPAPAQVANNNANTDSMGAANVALEKRVAALESRVDELDKFSDPSTPLFAIVGNPTGSGYALGRTAFGRFAVVVTNLEPYGSGTKLTLRILNLSGATLRSATITVNYSDRTLAEAIANPGGPHVSTSPATLSSTKSFPPNTWVTETLSLPDLTPEKVKDVTVGLDAAQLSASSE